MKIFSVSIVKILAQANAPSTTKAMLNTLVSTNGNPAEVAGGSAKPFCSEARDAISRYIYTGLQGGSIMKGWMKEENTMIACCSDGTRPVIFKIERIDVSE